LIASLPTKLSDPFHAEQGVEDTSIAIQTSFEPMQSRFIDATLRPAEKSILLVILLTHSQSVKVVPPDIPMTDVCIPALTGKLHITCE